MLMRLKTLVCDKNASLKREGTFYPIKNNFFKIGLKGGIIKHYSMNYIEIVANGSVQTHTVSFRVPIILNVLAAIAIEKLIVEPL
jgi:hypothetical protein